MDAVFPCRPRENIPAHTILHRVGCAVTLTIPHLGNFDIIEVTIDSGGNGMLGIIKTIR